MINSEHIIYKTIQGLHDTHSQLIEVINFINNQNLQNEFKHILSYYEGYKKDIAHSLIFIANKYNIKDENNPNSFICPHKLCAIDEVYEKSIYLQLLAISEAVIDIVFAATMEEELFEKYNINLEQLFNNVSQANKLYSEN